FPIPILDGGHLFFYLYELVFRRPVKVKTREVAQQIGLALLVSLMFFATYNDIVRYWKNIVNLFLKFV
ncbi:MAG TPA: site-2 protease family protein, partial [Geobacteraceae bacterium]